MLNQPACPSQPCMDPCTLTTNLAKAITGEATAVRDYTKLLGMATGEEDRMNLQKIIADESKHYRAFQSLYCSITGSYYQPQVPEPTFTTYVEGLREALYDEFSDAQFYRGILLAVCDPRIQRTFYEASTDEMMHATRFSRVLYLAEEAED